MSLYRRWVFGALLIAAQSVWVVDTAFAQAPPGPVQPSNSQPVGRSYAVEGIVVALLMAAAGYGVGRSSRRT